MDLPLTVACKHTMDGHLLSSATLFGRSRGWDGSKSVCWDFNNAFAVIFLTLMTAVDKNVVVNIRHSKDLTERSRGVAHSPLSLAILAGFTALQQCPLS